MKKGIVLSALLSAAVLLMSGFVSCSSDDSGSSSSSSSSTTKETTKETETKSNNFEGNTFSFETKDKTVKISISFSTSDSGKINAVVKSGKSEQKFGPFGFTYSAKDENLTMMLTEDIEIVENLGEEPTVYGYEDDKYKGELIGKKLTITGSGDFIPGTYVKE